MSNPESQCAFCDVDALLRENRVIRMTSTVLSIVSNPGFGDMHCIALPMQHVPNDYIMNSVLRHELADETALLRQAVTNAYKEKAETLGDDAGVSFIGLTKPEPFNPANGVSVYGHIHNHVYPLVRPRMTELVPAPRRPSDFHTVPSDMLVETRDTVRRHIELLTTDAIARATDHAPY